MRRAITGAIGIVAALGISGAAAARPTGPVEDARKAVACLMRYAQAPSSAAREGRDPDETARALRTLVGGPPARRWLCMPRSLESLAVPPPADAARLGACFRRVAAQSGDDAALRGTRACAALADALARIDAAESGVYARDEVSVSEDGTVRIRVALEAPDHVSVGESAVREAVAAQLPVVAACRAQGAGRLLVHVRASLADGDAFGIERDSQASELLESCVVQAAARARLSPRYKYARVDERWSALLEIELKPARPAAPPRQGSGAQ